MIRLNLIAILLISMYSSCDSKQILEITKKEYPLPPSGTKFRYLALGDSYTIGQSVDKEGTFPYLLQKKLVLNNIGLDEPRVIARTGWTCDELMSAIQSQTKPGDKFDMVSLLIGVNDQYRGYDVKDYPVKFRALLRKAIELSGDKPQHVVVISIPDYGATPYGSGNATAIGKEIDAYNAINKSIANELQCHYADVTGISRMAVSEPELVASDGLHPSAKMYALWVEKLLPLSVRILN